MKACAKCGKAMDKKNLLKHWRRHLARTHRMGGHRDYEPRVIKDIYDE
jgi:hypothetical protein